MKAATPVLVATTLAAAYSCSTGAANDRAGSDSGSSGVPAADSSSNVSSGAGGAYIPTLVQETVPPGATSVDVAAKFAFRMLGVSAPEGASAVATAAAHLELVDSTRQSVSVEGRFVAEQGDRADFWPKTLLVPDAWYWLVADPSSDVRFDVQSDSRTYQPGVPHRFESRFFTGSAPHIIDISLEVDKSGRVPFAMIRFSEPVVASTLEGGLGVLLGAAPVAGCVSLGNDGCVNQTSQTKVDGAVYRFDAPLDPASVSTLSFRLEGSVRGAARSVAEGNAVAGFPGTAQSIQPGFTTCGVPMSHCWHEPQEPTPTSP